MAAGDVTALPPSEHAPRLHPHLVTLIKWCASCLWGAAALVRSVLALPPGVPPLPPLAALIRSTLRRSAARRARVAATATATAARAPHISALATVECVVLRAPPPPHSAAVDVVFVHGLYGSLSNTWRQGQWMSRRKLELNHIPLKRPAPELPTPCSCVAQDLSAFSNVKRPRNDQACLCTYANEDLLNKSRMQYNARNDSQDNAAGQTDSNIDVLTIGSLHETKDEEKNSENVKIRKKDRDGSNNSEIENKNTNEEKYLNSVYDRSDDTFIVSNVNIAESYGNFVSDIYTDDRNGFTVLQKGCDNLDVVLTSIHKDGIKFDFKKDNKIFDESTSKTEDRLNTFTQAEDKNKIKEIKVENQTNLKHNSGLRHVRDGNMACETNEDKPVRACEVGCGCVCRTCYSSCWPRDWLEVDYPDARVISVNYTSDPYLWRPIWIKESKRLRLHERAEQMAQKLLALGVGSRPIVWVGHSKGGLFIKQIYTEAYEAYIKRAARADIDNSCLWSRTAGFMFYSVPHRGSPLADINIPPLVARSIELLEMGKDCSEVLALQQRWLRAASGDRDGGEGGGGAPVVRSLVETCRTLMAVLWLRIVSVESADAGIGALCGVSVDHREICKPSGRRCLLYRELLHVIDSALGRAPPPAPPPPALRFNHPQPDH